MKKEIKQIDKTKTLKLLFEGLNENLKVALAAETDNKGREEAKSKAKNIVHELLRSIKEAAARENGGGKENPAKNIEKLYTSWVSSLEKGRVGIVLEQASVILEAI